MLSAGSFEGPSGGMPAQERKVGTTMSYAGWLGHRAIGAATSAALACGVWAVLADQGAAQQAQPKGQKQQAPAAQQTPAKQAPAQPPAAKAATPAKGAAAPAQQTAWVKLCEKAALQHKDKEGKDVKEEKNICLTHHERLDGNTGMVLVSAAIRQIEGLDKQHLMIMVPLGMAIPPGVKAAVYNKEQWEKAQKNEKIDEKQLRPLDLRYSLCHPAGCTAEVEASKDMVEAMKSGGGLMVLAMNATAQPVAFPVPLDGFNSAHAGAPVDNKAYAQARGQLMQQIRQRHAELVKQQQEKQAAGQVPAPQPAAAQAAPAAPAKK
jgi:invasion protein IalB